MKKLIVLGLSLIALTTFSAVGPAPQPGFGLTSTNTGTTLSWAIVSANSANGGAPAVTYLNAGSGSNKAGVIFYKVVGKATCSTTNATVNIPLVAGGTNGFLTNAQVVVIQHLYNDTYDRRITDAGMSTTNLAVTVAPATTAPGDIIYAMAQAGFLFTADTTNNYGTGAGPIFVGQNGTPLLMEIGSLNADARIGLVSGYYLNPRGQ